ncbi:MAG: hypothetical protein SWZ49_32040 [Cyanobacteriota bacterium]|nr:hypothetical protein [Cyanobacteriota bacterium]
MSHKFSFLQAFTESYSWQCKLLGTCRQKYWLKSLFARLRVKYDWQVQKVRLLANMSQSRTQVCQVADFSQIASDFSKFVDASHAYKYCRWVADTFCNVSSEYVSRYNILHFKKYLPQSWLRWNFEQCEYLLQNIDFASINPFSLRKEDWFVNDLLSTYRNTYLSFRFSRNCN